MANFPVPESPEFSTAVRQFERTDPANADLFNNVTSKLFENDVWLKKKVDAIEEITLTELNQLWDA